MTAAGAGAVPRTVSSVAACAVMLLIWSSPAHGATPDGVGVWFDPGPSTTGPTAEASATWERSSAIDGEAERMSTVWYQASASAPVLRTPSYEVLGTVSSMAIDLDGGGSLPDGRPLPRRLDDAEAGLTTRVLWDDGWVAGLDVEAKATRAVGYGSPFRGDGEVNAFLRIPTAAHQAIVVLGSYATSRTWFSAPFLPGIAYQIIDGETWWALVGFPISYVIWHPVDWLSLEGGFVDAATVDATVHCSAAWAISIDYTWRQPEFRTGTPESLMVVSEMRGTITAAWTPSRACEADVLAGYSFARSFSAGATGSEQARDRRSLRGAPLLGLDLTWSF